MKNKWNTEKKYRMKEKMKNKRNTEKNKRMKERIKINHVLKKKKERKNEKTKEKQLIASVSKGKWSILLKEK